MSKYLDETGVARLWEKTKAKMPSKTSQLTNDSDFLDSSDFSDITNSEVDAICAYGDDSFTGYVAEFIEDLTETEIANIIQ